MFDKDAIQELSKAQAIAAAAEAIASNPGQAVALPSEFQVHDLEKFLDTRRRMRGTMETSVIADFAKYVAANKESGATVFIDQDAMVATAVLNLGTPDAPGHTDNRARLGAKRTAAYTALLGVVGRALEQATAAEFCEDWAPMVTFFKDNESVSPAQAVAAIRKITVESMRKLEAEETQLSASKSTFESVKASSGELPLPTHLYFVCPPHFGFDTHTFVLRVSVVTSNDKPRLVLRFINLEAHTEEMAIEFAQRIGLAVDDIPVLIGSYKAS